MLCPTLPQAFGISNQNFPLLNPAFDFAVLLMYAEVLLMHQHPQKQRPSFFILPCQGPVSLADMDYTQSISSAHYLSERRSCLRFDPYLQRRTALRITQMKSSDTDTAAYCSLSVLVQRGLINLILLLDVGLCYCDKTADKTREQGATREDRSGEV